MALVRCPIHKIPYNDQNPRGCPACAREKEGGSQASMMQELAKSARRAGGGSTVTETPPVSPGTPQASPRRMSAAARPRPVTTEGNWLLELLWQLGRPRTIVVSVGLIGALGLVLVILSGPAFVNEPHPYPLVGTPRPLPIEPGMPLETVFAILGTQTPQAHPDAASLARYSYGSDLTIDALNARVYALTFAVPNRTWHGLRTGISRQNAEGALALLAPPVEASAPNAAPPELIGKYLAYPSLEQRPRRVLRAEVRPPNGCYDVLVELRPRVIGVLVDGDRRYAAIGPEGTDAEWTVTQIRVVSRSMPGPYAPAVAC